MSHLMNLCLPFCPPLSIPQPISIPLPSPPTRPFSVSSVVNYPNGVSQVVSTVLPEPPPPKLAPGRYFVTRHVASVPFDDTPPPPLLPPGVKHTDVFPAPLDASRPSTIPRGGGFFKSLPFRIPFLSPPPPPPPPPSPPSQTIPSPPPPPVKRCGSDFTQSGIAARCSSPGLPQRLAAGDCNCCARCPFDNPTNACPFPALADKIRRDGLSDTKTPVYRPRLPPRESFYHSGENRTLNGLPPCDQERRNFSPPFLRNICNSLQSPEVVREHRNNRKDDFVVWSLTTDEQLKHPQLRPARDLSPAPSQSRANVRSWSPSASRSETHTKAPEGASAARRPFPVWYSPVPQFTHSPRGLSFAAETAPKPTSSRQSRRPVAGPRNQGPLVATAIARSRSPTPVYAPGASNSASTIQHLSTSRRASEEATCLSQLRRCPSPSPSRSRSPTPTQFSSRSPSPSPSRSRSPSLSLFPSRSRSPSLSLFPSPSRSPSPKQFPAQTRSQSPTQFPAQARSHTPTQFSAQTRSHSPPQFPAQTRSHTPTRFPTQSRSHTPTQFSVRSRSPSPSPSRSPSPSEKTTAHASRADTPRRRRTPTVELLVSGANSVKLSTHRANSSICACTIKGSSSEPRVRIEIPSSSAPTRNASSRNANPFKINSGSRPEILPVDTDKGNLCTECCRCSSCCACSRAKGVGSTASGVGTNQPSAPTRDGRRHASEGPRSARLARGCSSTSLLPTRKRRHSHRRSATTSDFITRCSVSTPANGCPNSRSNVNYLRYVNNKPRCIPPRFPSFHKYRTHRECVPREPMNESNPMCTANARCLPLRSSDLMRRSNVSGTNSFPCLQRTELSLKPCGSPCGMSLLHTLAAGRRSRAWPPPPPCSRSRSVFLRRNTYSQPQGMPPETPQTSPVQAGNTLKDAGGSRLTPIWHLGRKGKITAPATPVSNQKNTSMQTSDFNYTQIPFLTRAPALQSGETLIRPTRRSSVTHGPASPDSAISMPKRTPSTPLPDINYRDRSEKPSNTNTFNFNATIPTQTVEQVTRNINYSNSEQKKENTYSYWPMNSDLKLKDPSETCYLFNGETVMHSLEPTAKRSSSRTYSPPPSCGGLVRDRSRSPTPQGRRSSCRHRTPSPDQERRIRSPSLEVTANKCFNSQTPLSSAKRTGFSPEPSQCPLNHFLLNRRHMRNLPHFPPMYSPPTIGFPFPKELPTPVKTTPQQVFTTHIARSHQPKGPASGQLQLLSRKCFCPTFTPPIATPQPTFPKKTGYQLTDERPTRPGGRYQVNKRCTKCPTPVPPALSYFKDASAGPTPPASTGRAAHPQRPNAKPRPPVPMRFSSGTPKQAGEIYQKNVTTPQNRQGPVVSGKIQTGPGRSVRAGARKRNSQSTRGRSASKPPPDSAQAQRKKQATTKSGLRDGTTQTPPKSSGATFMSSVSGTPFGTVINNSDTPVKSLAVELHNNGTQTTRPGPSKKCGSTCAAKRGSSRQQIRDASFQRNGIPKRPCGCDAKSAPGPPPSPPPAPLPESDQSVAPSMQSDPPQSQQSSEPDVASSPSSPPSPLIGTAFSDRPELGALVRPPKPPPLPPMGPPLIPAPEEPPLTMCRRYADRSCSSPCLRFCPGPTIRCSVSVPFQYFPGQRFCYPFWYWL